MRKSIVYLWRFAWWILKSIAKLIWWILRLLLVPDTDYSKKARPEIEPNPPEIAPLIEEESIAKIGSITPVEEDHNLRSFTVFNAEGEIYRIDTAAPGPFHGPVWTRILSCYETRQTFFARIMRTVHGKSGHPSGYQIKIGDIKAFMPNYHSLRKDLDHSLNVRIAILYIDPVSRRVTVSARLAYELLFGQTTLGETGEQSEALYWDYDESFVYFFLPGEYIGRIPRDEIQDDPAALMGTIAQVKIESIDEEEREVLLSLADSSISADLVTSQLAQGDNYE